MSRVKNTSAASEANLTNQDLSHTVTSVADAELFNGFFEQVNIDTRSSQGQNQGNDREDQKQKNENQDNVQSVSKSEKSAAGNKTPEKPEKAAKSDEMDEKERAESEQLESEADKIEVEELSRQLGVILDTVRVKPQTQNFGVGPFQNVNIISSGQIRTSLDENVLREIPSEILRKVDVKTLDDQLKRIMRGDEVLDVDVPREDGEAQNDLLMQTRLEETALQDEEFHVDLVQTGDFEIRQSKQEVDIEVTRITPEISLAPETEVQVRQREENISLETETHRETMSTGTEDLNRALASSENFTIKISESRFQFSAGEDQKEQPGVLDFATEDFNLEDLFKTLIKPVAAGTEKHPSLLQQAQPQNVTAATPEVAERIKGKVEQVILNMAKTGKPNVTRIQLHPEQLGKIDIRLEVNKERMVKASIVTDSQETRDAILKHMPQIRAILASENMMLDHFSAQHDQKHFESGSLQYFNHQERQAGQGYGEHRGGTYSSGNREDLPETPDRKKMENTRGRANARVNITV